MNKQAQTEYMQLLANLMYHAATQMDYWSKVHNSLSKVLEANEQQEKIIIDLENELSWWRRRHRRSIKAAYNMPPPGEALCQE
jgi:tryptophan 2,3-dioxygenase